MIGGGREKEKEYLERKEESSNIKYQKPKEKTAPVRVRPTALYRRAKRPWLNKRPKQVICVEAKVYGAPVEGKTGRLTSGNRQNVPCAGSPGEVTACSAFGRITELSCT